jgi:predicted Zn-ribbon and HTH transcriptional regulator
VREHYDALKLQSVESNLRRIQKFARARKRYLRRLAISKGRCPRCGKSCEFNFTTGKPYGKCLKCRAQKSMRVMIKLRKQLYAIRAMEMEQLHTAKA